MSGRTLAEFARSIDAPPGYALAVMLHTAARNGGSGAVSLNEWIAEATAADITVARVTLTGWAGGLPPVDTDGGELPVTDEEFIAYRVAEEQDAAGIANDLSRAYDDGLSEAGQIGPVDYPDGMSAAAEAVLEIENHRAACREALALLG